MTRAACGRAIRVHDDDFEPFEVEVRGIQCVIAPGFCTHAIGPAGSPFWSATGFRSFGIATDNPGEVAAIIEAYIKRPEKAGGCGDKLTRWWPSYVLQWRQSLAFEIEIVKERGREGVWSQWGPDRWKECWTGHDAKLAAAVARMQVEGIDPNHVGPPAHFKGKWPKITHPQERIAA
jgi:hypothetical protein